MDKGKIVFVVFGLIISFGVFAENVSAVSCGELITKDTTLSSDLTCPWWRYWVSLGFGANDITLDCDGHAISGGGWGIGIWTNSQSGITIKNCVLNNVRDGIKVDSSTNSIIADNTVNSNHYGIILSHSGGNIIENNTANSNDWEGIYLYNSNNNNVTNNTVDSNGHNGIYLLGNPSYNYNNYIYHNNIINNPATDTGLNTWDNGYQSGGNYWGPCTDCNADGVCDSSHSLSGAQDNYPVVTQNGWLYIVPDTTPPTGTISINNGATHTSTTSVTLTMSYSDASPSGCSQMKFSNDGITYSTAEAYSESTSWTLSAGDITKTVYAKYKDGAGNWMTTPINDTIILDTTGPTINILSPQHTIYNQYSVDLNYTVNDASGIDWVSYSLDDKPNVTTSGVITTFSNSAGGDLGTEESITFSGAGSDTSIYLRVPKNSTIINAVMNVSGYLYSDYSGTSFSLASQDGFNMGATWDGTYFWVVGALTVEVYKYYSSGTYTGTHFSITEDAAPAGITWDGSNFWVTGLNTQTVYQYNSGGTYTGTSFSVAGQDIDPEGITWDGTYLWVAGQVSDKIYKYYINGTYTGTNFSVAGQDGGPEGLTWDGSSFWISGAITDKLYQYDSSGTYTGVSFSTGSQDNIPEGLTWDGSSFWMIGTVADKAFQYYYNESPTNLSLDTANDSQEDWSLSGELNSTNSPQEVDLNITAIQSYIDSNPADAEGFVLVPLNIASGSAGIVELDALYVKYYSDWTLTGLSDGPHNVTVYANDTAGNMNSSTVYFSVDTTPPSITITSPENTTYSTTSIDLNVSVDEPIDTWWYSLNSGTDTTFIPSTTIAVSEGLNKLVVYANDTTGNVNSLTVYFSVDTTPPSITITSPENITYATNSVDLNYSVYDSSGVDWIGYSLDGQDTVTTSGEITTFSNSAGGDLGTEENITFPGAGSDTSIYLRVPKNSTVTAARMNVGGHLYEEWGIDSTIASGLGDVGGWSAPTVFQKDGTWYLISGAEQGWFYGYNWTGSTWQSDPAIASGLGDVGMISAPTVFQKDGTWYLISGAEHGWFYGYNWTGSTWQSDPAIVSGLGRDWEGSSYPLVFQKNGIWYSISGRRYGSFNGYNWTGSAWQSDPAIVSGLGDVGFHSHPSVFYKGSTWYLISGEQDGTFFGYKWIGSAWQSDPAIASGLGDVGMISAPSVFQKDGMKYLISGNYFGSFNGFNVTSVSYPTNLSIDTANDSHTDWSITGELNSTNLPQTVDLNITAINDYVSSNSADKNGFVYVPINITSASAGIVRLDALSVKYHSNAILTSLSDGRHNVTVYANDTVGNMNSSTVYFTVDTTITGIFQQEVTTTLIDGEYVAEIDAVNEVDSYIKLSTGSEPVSGTITITRHNSTPFGTNPDLSLGNNTKSIGKFIKIDESESIRENISWALIKIYYTQEELDASGIPESTMSLIWYNESSEEWIPLDGLDWVYETGLDTTDVGPYSGYVWANVSHFSVFGIIGAVDVEPPDITISSPLLGNYSYTGNITLKFNATDDISGVASVTAYLNGSDVTSGQVIDLLNFSIGEYALVVEATDNVGNNATANVTFNVIDDVLPEVNITSPENGSFVVGLVNITGEVYDLYLDKTSLKIDGVEVSDELPYQWDTYESTGWVHVIELTAVDTSNNSASVNVTVFTDNAPPTIDIKAPLERDYSYTENVTIDFNVTDDLSGVKSVNATLGGAEISNGTVLDLFNFTLGKHIFALEAEDFAGNYNLTSVTFRVIDDIPPEISIIEPTEREYKTIEGSTVNFTAWDEKSDVVSLTAELDGVSIENEESIDISSLSLGNHTLVVTAVDTYGNNATEKVTFSVAPTPVTIKVTPVAKNVKEDNNFDFMVHTTSDYNLSRAAETGTATFAEGYDVQAVLYKNGSVNIKVEVGTLETREYTFTLTSIGSILVESNTVSVTPFTPSNKSGKNNKTNDALKVNVRLKETNSKAEVTIDLIATGNMPVKAVYVQEYIPEELKRNTWDGAAFTNFGLIWSVGTVEHKETVKYTLALPEVSEPTTYELRTVVEYQTAEDLETLEKTAYLTVNLKGQVRLDEGKDKKSVKAKGKGYTKVHWGRPNFKKGDSVSPGKGKKKGHDKDKGKPEKLGKPDKPPKDSGPPDSPGKSRKYS